MNRLKFWSSEENYFLLQISPACLSAALITVDSEKRLACRRFWPETDWTRLNQRFSLNSLVRNVIIAADSSLAYTAIIPVRLLRENERIPLSAVELENMLSQEVGRVFNQYRQQAASELGVDDLEVVLGFSRVSDFKADGHRVISPLELRASRIEAVLELMLTTRPVLQQIKEFLRFRPNYFFTEIGRAELAVLREDQKLPLKLIRLDEPGSYSYLLEEALVGQSIRRGRLAWSPEGLLRTISAEWGVSREVADEIYRAYLARRMSPANARLFSEILAREVSPLFTEMNRTKLRGRIFVDTILPLPFDLPFKKGQIELWLPDPYPLLERYGFNPGDLDLLPRSQTFARLAPFLSYYHDRSDSTINRWLRRHLNWLGAGGVHSAR